MASPVRALHLSVPVGCLASLFAAGGVHAQGEIGSFLLEEDEHYGCVASTHAVLGDLDRLRLYLAVVKDPVETYPTHWIEGPDLEDIEGRGEFDDAGRFFAAYVIDGEAVEPVLWQYDATPDNRHARPNVAYAYSVPNALYEARERVNISLENHQEGREGLIGYASFETRSMDEVLTALRECAAEQ